ncbi:hypothetical protein NEAUS03_1972 [Nematocida ausubeli]|nr:hypothetical protein NEAUS03_1972 [Nematocida ausubeli]
MKIRSSVIWIKAAALISVLLMNTHRADIELYEIESTLQFEVATNESSVKINPDGPLNFLRGLIYQKMECMYNKRFFAPQIDTEYKLEGNSKMTNNHNMYIYSRNQQMDKAYKAQSTNKMDVYSEQYHSHLIELFPSPIGDITIETRENQSFIQFLRAKTTEKHALQILAMLLLFSEGVDIPIEVTNSVLNVYETDKKDEIYFTVPMEIACLDSTADKAEPIGPEKVKQIISFFQENATNSEVLSLMMDKCSKEEVMSGKFLDSPKFLIQSYIFGFIITADRATEFIQTVHTMVEKYAPKTETPSKDGSVYDRLFSPASTTVDTDSITLLNRIQEVLNTYRVFPFTDSTQLPAYSFVPRYTRKTNTFSNDRSEDYSNSIECMILSLFCCLTYDPSYGSYFTYNLENVSETLEEFFSMDNQPFDTTKVEFQKKWCKVVADLEEPSIAYCKERNQLDGGLINMLMVIAEIVNAPKAEKDKLLEFSKCLNSKTGELRYTLFDSIKVYTKNILKRLSNSGYMEIEFSNSEINQYNNGRNDISGRITITFEHGLIKNTLVLELFKDNSSVDMKPVIINSTDDRMEKMNVIAECCQNKTTFVENLFSAYVDSEIRKIDDPENTNKFIKEQIYNSVENNLESINRVLLLMRKNNNLEYKKNLVTSLIVYNMGKNLSPEHPVIRFASNILGGMRLDSFNNQLEMLPAVVFSGAYDENGKSLNYPNLKLVKRSLMIATSRIGFAWFAIYVLESDISTFIVWIKYCIDNLGLGHKNGIRDLFSASVTTSICEYIFKDGDMKYAIKLDLAIAKDYPDLRDKMLNDLHNEWFAHLVLEENLNMKLIKINFSIIRNPTRSVSLVKNDTDKEKTEKNLKELEAHLCKDKNSTTKFRELVR